jgi:hypothetical protein
LIGDCHTLIRSIKLLNGRSNIIGCFRHGEYCLMCYRGESLTKER